jgi:Tfp pilus assembly protein PilX
MNRLGRRLFRRRRAAMMVMAMVTLAVVSAIGAQVAISLVAAHRQARRYHDELQAAWLAESGLERARARIAEDEAYDGETWQPVVVRNADGDQAGSVEITLESADNGDRRITARAHWPAVEVHRVLVERAMVVPATEKEAP